MSKTASARFVTFEGLEGVGKSTAMALAGDILKERQIGFVTTREPGGTPVAESLRALVLGEHDESMADTTELLMMFAARAQNLAEVVRPALNRGQWVLCDRFTDATIAYQGYGRGVSLSHIQWLADWVHGDLWPDRTILLEAPHDIALARRTERGQSDRIERENQRFFDRVGQGYDQLAKNEPERFRRVNTAGDLDSVSAQLATVIDQLSATAPCSG
ncbi:MAG: dTMP kinase [Pseudomonadota bacterium]